MSIQTPRFIDNLERRYHRFGIENLGMMLVILQGVGFLALNLAPQVAKKFVFNPDLFLRGEIWRAITFIAMPTSLGIWIVLALFFLYWVMQILEQTWGPFKTTLYLLVGLTLSLMYSIATGFTLETFLYIEYTLAFAVAINYPHEEMHIWGILPVRLWMLGLLYLIMVIYDFAMGGWLLRGYILTVFGSYFIFFGQHHFQELRNYLRRRNWRG
ncbi:MAG: hypothetical protein U1F16_01020 [Turneriella sp.]